MTMDLKTRKPVTDYFKGHGRFRHLTPDQVQEIQTRVDQDWERLRAKCVNVK
jgi:pyruvate/2-oxoacid:ferredoxin oxidoreductase beta subunit